MEQEQTIQEYFKEKKEDVIEFLVHLLEEQENVKLIEIKE